MRSFRFVHAADLHLGSPFRGLALKDAQAAARFAEASRAAFTALVDEAIGREAAFLVIAGDLYDGDWRDVGIAHFFNREVARLHRAGIATFVLKGNHDADSVVSRTIPLPDSVHTFPSAAPHTFRLDDLRVALHGQSFEARATEANLAATYPEPVAGWLNIGVLHTSMSGRPGHDTYAPCSAEDLIRRGYDYWALGHVHAFEVVARDPWIVFPGVLQGRGAREPGPSGAVVAEAADGAVTSVERLIVDRARWLVVSADIAEAETVPDALDGIDRAVAAAVEGVPTELLLGVRVVLGGESPLHGRLVARENALRDDVQALLDGRREDVWLEDLRIEARAPAAGAGALPAGLADIDLMALLRDVAADPDLGALAREAVDKVVEKMPRRAGKLLAARVDPESLVADATALLDGRHRLEEAR